MNRLKLAIIPLTAALAAWPAYGETILIPVSRQGADRGDLHLPTTGNTQQHVKQQYGEPEAISKAVGEPPISRWDYSEFSVYFESGTVIHSVLKHRPNQSPAK